MWDSVMRVLAMVHGDKHNSGRAASLLKKMETFTFVLNMKLMLKVLRIINDLSLLLQKKDRNII
jgi:hypothetical protein